MKIEGISADEHLMNEFIRHEKDEHVFLDSYKTILDETPPPLVKFLLQLIISDEEKHHALIHAMISSIKGSLEWATPDGAIGKMGQIKDWAWSAPLKVVQVY